MRRPELIQSRHVSDELSTVLIVLLCDVLHFWMLRLPLLPWHKEANLDAVFSLDRDQTCMKSNHAFIATSRASADASSHTHYPGAAVGETSDRYGIAKMVYCVQPGGFPCKIFLMGYVLSRSAAWVTKIPDVAPALDVWTPRNSR
jgi:hypothetical protein